MSTTQIVLFALLIGIFTGMRSLTPIAATAWAAHLGWIKLVSPLAWLSSLWAAILFTLLAIGELIADKLPKTPSRTAPPGLIARVLMGGLSGAAVYMAGHQSSLIFGAIVGIIGALIGTYLGYQLRTRLVKVLGTRDFVVAVLEDLIAIGGSLFAVSHL
jgi:uncharacterized membrane protein